jgi:hypothetical protein
MRYLSRQRSIFGFFKSSSRSRTSSPVPLEAGDDDPDDLPVGQVEEPLEIVICVSDLILM